jgi:XRE family aerobic/anaerobic benzoate catabolism transcriptional regulator
VEARALGGAMESGSDRREGGAVLLLFQVGRKVRNLRRSRNLTRRNLALAARISERYLGQLENGQANVSLNILHRLIAYFDVPLSAILPEAAHLGGAHEPLAQLISKMSLTERREAYQLLSEKFATTTRARKGVALVGLRGAGKSTLGQLSARLLGLPFMRLTRLVSDHSGLDIAELMELSGQNGFRRLELETLAKLIDEPGQVILETSGGIAEDSQTYELLLRNFFTIWIKARPEDHMSRVIEQKDLRPITGRKQAMKDLVRFLNERSPAYARCEYVLDTSGRPVRDALAELVEVALPIIEPQAS